MTSHIDTNRKGPRGISRRQLLSGTGAGAALLLGGSLPAPGQCGEKPKVLKLGDRVELDCPAEEIIRRAYELGYRYEKEHGGCARCTVAACQDAIPLVAVDVGLFRGSTCLDGGATPVNVQNCGAFTGAGMVIGHLCGSTRGETFEGSAKLAHELLHKVYDRFKEEYGTVLCRDVRKGAEGDCPEVVGRAAQWVAEVLLAEFTDYEPPEEPKAKEGDRAQGKE
ncbi:MAG TPA: C-GCAxxG-C-C family protein [Thermoguttaceae bacterium]|nr:C-GCAxxG-C-C family protein [Thermoguttaceae bacterium]